jgi:hypothetical protein
MTLDGFLTVLTIVLAAYAVMPSVLRLRIGLRSRALILLSVVCFSIIIVLEFSSLTSKLCLLNVRACNALDVFPDLSWMTKGQAAFLVVMIWLFSASALISRRKLRAGSLPALSRLVSELAYQQKYAELVDLLSPQLGLVHLHLRSSGCAVVLSARGLSAVPAADRNRRRSAARRERAARCGEACADY